MALHHVTIQSKAAGIDPSEVLDVTHIVHLRNALEHYDDRGWYQNEYLGWRWILGGTDAEVFNFAGLDLIAALAGLDRLEAML